MYCYGKNTIKGLIESKTQFEEVYISNKFKDANMLNFLDKNRIRYKKISENELNKLSDNANHQGIMAKMFEYNYYNFDQMVLDNKDNENSLIIILDGLEDPQNFGSIIRSAEALNVSGIVIPKNRSVKVNPTVAKVSTGAINEVKIAQVTNLRQVISKLKEENYWVVGAHMDTDTLYDEMDYKMKIALVIGSEGKGISMQLKKECDYLVKLPMYGKVSSLNAAVSAAIIMYEINSNRHK
ncbi:23S rRNA (guanosine2251-2'-O)-methyltransferase [Bacilli bacterium PM5-3]|nr:23S rRNA (guanosine2251-2'-O)-methyltransferase [Bacilli bacterium PM5-3]MDH6603391.1 23S rRNA (guanosine2251-2'-O)-methyltransferase [Bacilli bacterium PM5-9]